MLEQVWTEAVRLTGGYLPNLLGALALLVGGWIVALILAAIVRGALRRTTLDDRLARWMTGDEGEQVDIERMVGKVAFYLVMLMVLVGVFQVLDLAIVTQPLNAMLSEVLRFAPRILGGAALLLLAWILASALRKVVTVTLGRLDVDRRLGAEATEEGEAVPLSSTVAEAVYWLVFLLFLPAVLGVLEIEGLLAPVQSLVETVLGFLPNLLAASLILGLGWFAARLVQRIVSNLLAAAGVDGLGERVGLGTVAGTRKLSSLVGLVVYVFILVPVVISSLEALEIDAVTVPARDMLSQVLGAVPEVFAAALLLGIAYFVARLVAELITSVLAGAGFDGILAHLGLSRADALPGRRPSALAGYLVMVAILLFASIEAAGLMGFEALAGMLSSFVYFAGDVLLGIVVFGIGLYLGRLADSTVRASGTPQSGLLATAARCAIIVLTAAMALRQMGLAEDIINLAFGLLLGAVAVAVALAFGLGAREVAGRHVQRWTAALEGSGGGDVTPGASAPQP